MEYSTLKLASRESVLMTFILEQWRNFNQSFYISLTGGIKNNSNITILLGLTLANTDVAINITNSSSYCIS